MRPIVTYLVALSCWSVTLVSPAKTSELIKMPFGFWAPMDTRNHVVEGGPDLTDVSYKS